MMIDDEDEDAAAVPSTPTPGTNRTLFTTPPPLPSPGLARTPSPGLAHIIYNPSNITVTKISSYTTTTTKSLNLIF